MAIYLEHNELKDAYRDAVDKRKDHQKHYDELERLAANELRGDLGPTLPKVNDGSLAALMHETYMRVWPTTPSGLFRVTDRDEAWLQELVNIQWTKRIIPFANTDGDWLSKWQQDVYQTQVYGGSPKFSFLTKHGNYVTADFTLPYVRDVALEPGKKSDLSCDFIFMDSYYTKLQLKSIIKEAEDEKAKAKAEGREPESKWDLKALKSVVDAGPTGKEAEQRSPSEREHNSHADKFYKFTTVFHRGYLAPFFTFSEAHSCKVVRTAENTNPTGDLPITYTYGNIDTSNPYGKGQAEMSGGTQNVLDHFTQLHVLSGQLAAQPPMKITGDRSSINMNTLRWAPHAMWLIGNNATVEAQDVAPQFLRDFPNTYGLYKTQLMNMQGTTDAAVGGEAGNPTFSKTHAGVELQEERTNAHDNFLRQRGLSSYERVAKNLMNIYLNNMHGSEVVRLLDEEAERLTKAGIEIPETKELEVIWENVRATVEFDVETDNSPEMDNEKVAEQLKEVITLATQDPMFDQSMAQAGYRFNRGEAYKTLFAKGLDNEDKIFEQISPEDQQQMMAEQEAIAAQAQMGGMQDPQAPAGAEGMPVAPEGEMPPTEAPMAAEEPMPGQEPVDDPDIAELKMELAQTMEQYGVDQQEAALVMQARRQGAGEEAIAAYLTQQREGANV